MTSNLDKYKSDLEELVELGKGMNTDLGCRRLKEIGALDQKHESTAKEIEGAFESHYQSWYTESCAVIRQLIPDRLSEFEHLYKGDVKRKEINSDTFNIQDWLNGIRTVINPLTSGKYYDDFAIVSMRFRTQLDILRSVETRFESTLFDIRLLVQADLFDSELDKATELCKRGFLRGAGAIAGVVLEKHLRHVSETHGLKLRKKHPTIGDFNQLLKDNNVIDTANWRFNQHLGDLRNLCDHSKEREPTKGNVTDLIRGVTKVIKTVF